MNSNRYPTTWLFELDERTTRMSLVSTGPTQPPIMATPDAIHDILDTFYRSSSTPEEVRGILDVSDHLLVTSAIHYEFAAVAVEKALQALELMVRYKVGETDHASKVSMARLVERLRLRFELRPELDELLRDMTRLRNNWVGHPRNAAAFAMVSAVGFLGHIYGAVAELADLADSPA